MRSKEASFAEHNITTVTKQRMPKTIREYYLAWIKGPTLLEHWLDRDRFYRFVKAYIRYSRKELHGSWLRPFLEADLRKQYADDQHDDQHMEEFISKVIILFEHLVEFHQAKL